jgi:hypothetical protein
MEIPTNHHISWLPHLYVATIRGLSLELLKRLALSTDVLLNRFFVQHGTAFGASPKIGFFRDLEKSRL